jgi:hypothetical protein
MSESTNSLFVGGVSQSKPPSLTKKVGGLTETTETIVETQARITAIQEQLVGEMKEHRGLLIYGFIILLVMVGTMILMVASMLIDARQEQKDIIYVEKGNLRIENDKR